MRYLGVALTALFLAGLVLAQSPRQPTGNGNQQQPQEPAAQPANAPATDQRGTQKEPLIIKLAPAVKSAAEIAQEAADRKERGEAESRKDWLDTKLVYFNRQLAHYTKDLAWVAFLQVLALVGQVFVLWLAFREARRTADIANEAMHLSNRAYVHHYGERWTSHPHTSDGHIFWRIRPRWFNSGNTPTRNLIVFAAYEFRDGPLPKEFGFVAKLDPSAIPALIQPKGLIESGPFDIDGSDLQLVKDGKKRLYIWGVAVYGDVFSGARTHLTRFCVEATNITGEPSAPYNAEKNPLEIMFATYKAHNCEDEDCARTQQV